jgi:hypothetical protein
MHRWRQNSSKFSLEVHTSGTQQMWLSLDVIWYWFWIFVLPLLL